MLKNYLKIAFRNLRKRVGFSVINIFGLSTGIASCLLLLLYVQDEMSYDKFHKYGDSIYRIAGNYDQGGTDRNKSAQTTFLLAPELERISGIEKWVRIQPASGLFKYKDKVFQEEHVLFADSTFFEIFSFPLLKGNPKKVLDDVNTMVLSKSMAHKYFGDEEPVGKLLTVDDIAVVVNGVMADFPKNSHFKADFVLSMSTALPGYPQWILDNASGTSHYTYIKTKSGAQPKSIETSLIQIVSEKYPFDLQFFLQPIESIHLTSHLNNEIEANGDLVYIYIFLSVAFLIIVIACINYTNLAIAKSAVRSKEVGLRKIVGANRRQLIIQHLTESTILAVFAVLLGGLIAEVLLPYFNQLTGKTIQQSIISDLNFLSLLVLAGIVVGLLAGSYPAFYLSGLDALKVFKNEKLRLKGGALSFRRILIVFQFTMAALLIIGTLFIQKQLSFMSNSKLGINTNRVLYFDLPTNEIRSKYASIKTELLSHKDFTSVTVSNNNPTARVTNWRGYKLNDKNITVPTIVVGQDYFETLQTSLIVGRTFSEDVKSDETQAYVINESALQFMEIQGDGIGTKIIGDAFTGRDWSKKEATIVGVVKDFHFTSLHAKIQPAVFSLYNSEITSPINYMIVRYNSTNLNETINKLTDVWNKYANGRPINFTFMDDEIQHLYQNERRFLEVFLLFSFIAISIACLGALGLVSYTVSQLTRQIGVRKVLGASVWSIVKLVNQSFFKIIAISFLIAIPVSLYFIKSWLENFAYKIDLGWVPYLEAAALLILIAAITTSIQSIKAAVTNPVKALRQE